MSHGLCENVVKCDCFYNHAPVWARTFARSFLRQIRLFVQGKKYAHVLLKCGFLSRFINLYLGARHAKSVSSGRPGWMGRFWTFLVINIKL